MRYIALTAFVATLAFVQPAHAQAYTPTSPVPVPQQQAAPTQSFDQYPSFIEMNSTQPDGTQVVLRCGYSMNGVTIIADPAYMEMSFLNPTNGSYLRYQRIDNKIIITSPAPGVVGRFVIQVSEPNGAVIAKNCTVNSANDTVANCTLAQPFLPPTQATTQDQNAASQCGTLLEKSIPQLDRLTYSAPKTEIFKNSMRQKVNILESR